MREEIPAGGYYSLRFGRRIEPTEIAQVQDKYGRNSEAPTVEDRGICRVKAVAISLGMRLARS